MAMGKDKAMSYTIGRTRNQSLRVLSLLAKLIINMKNQIDIEWLESHSEDIDIDNVDEASSHKIDSFLALEERILEGKED